MKTENIMLIGLLVLVVGGLLFTFISLLSNTKAMKTDSKPNMEYTKDLPGLETISSGSTNSGDVSIELTPQGVKDGKLVVEIAVNTHSVGLDNFDLKKITTLEYNKESIKPKSAPKLSGHHSSGELVFDVEEDINNFKISIKGIPKVEERVFEW